MVNESVHVDLNTPAEKRRKRGGLRLIIWSIEWAVVLALPIIGVSYLLQFMIQGSVTWTPLSWIGEILAAALILFWVEEAIFGNLFKQRS